MASCGSPSASRETWRCRSCAGTGSTRSRSRRSSAPPTAPMGSRSLPTGPPIPCSGGPSRTAAASSRPGRRRRSRPVSRATAPSPTSAWPNASTCGRTPSSRTSRGRAACWPSACGGAGWTSPWSSREGRARDAHRGRDDGLAPAGSLRGAAPASRLGRSGPGRAPRGPRAHAPAPRAGGRPPPRRAFHHRPRRPRPHRRVTRAQKMSFLDSRTRSAPQGFGQPVLRREDARLLTGGGCYSDDFNLPGQAYACLVRSPHAHARIRGIDSAVALVVPGVIALFTGGDAAADGLRPIPHRPVPSNPHEVPPRSHDGAGFFIAPHPPLPADTARFVGEAVAMVIADTPAAARDGAERVVVAYEPLAAITATAGAAEAGAPIVWNETSSNVCVDSEAGDPVAADAAFARAAHVVRLRTWVPRVTGVPMEPRAALGAYDEASGRYTLYAGSGGVVCHKSDLAGTLGVPESAVRVVAREVGGNFGTRNSFYPEFALVAWAAKRLGRPVKWTCERREAFLTDYQGRDLVSHAELA